MATHDTAPAEAAETPATEGRTTADRIWRTGRAAWGVLGVLGVVVVLGYLASRLSLLIVPVVLALFPATLLVPVTGWLKERGVPAALAAAGTIVGSILVFFGLIGAMIPLVLADLPDLAESVGGGLAELERFLQRGPLGLEIDGFADLFEMAREQVGAAGDLLPQAVGAAIIAFETIAGLLLMFVVLFFYLKDGRRLADGLVAVAPARVRPRLAGIADRSWDTLGSYFRGQLLVALIDALLIGIGLLLLRVPLAIPLAVLIFFGGLFPIIGAVTTGALAVLVALAHGGLVLGLVVLAIVLGVQQVESNVLEPLILSRAIHLHPLVVLLSITAGALLLGILGAFLAVPFAAIVDRALRYLSDTKLRASPHELSVP